MGLSLFVFDLKWAFRPGEPAFLSVPSLEVGEGNLAAVTGPSGAGKSTLLFLLAGMETPASGLLRWGSYDLGSDRPVRRDQWRRRHVGLVFQDFQLVPELTALENVLLPLTFDRWSIRADERRRGLSLLSRLGVVRTEARASTLSRGEMQRTALARALLGRPPVVLADEPTASLDADHEAAVVELLEEYCRQEGATVIVSTHQSQLQQRADRRIALDHGALVRREL